MSENATDEDPGRWEGGAAPRLAEGGPGGSAAGCCPCCPSLLPPCRGRQEAFRCLPFFFYYLFWLEDVVLLQ